MGGANVQLNKAQRAALKRLALKGPHRHQLDDGKSARAKEVPMDKVAERRLRPEWLQGREGLDELTTNEVIVYAMRCVDASGLRRVPVSKVAVALHVSTAMVKRYYRSACRKLGV